MDVFGSSSHCLYCLNYSGAIGGEFGECAWEGWSRNTPENLVGIRQYGGEVFAWGLTDLTVFVSGKELRQLSIFSKTSGLPKHVKDENGRSNPTGARHSIMLEFFSENIPDEYFTEHFTEYFSEYFTEFKTWGFQNAGFCSCPAPAPTAPRGASFQWDSAVRSNCRATFASSFPRIRSVRMGRCGAGDTSLFLLQPQPVNISEPDGDQIWPDPLRMTESGLNHGYIGYIITVSTAIHRPRSWSPALCQCCQSCTGQVAMLSSMLNGCASMLCSFGPSPFPFVEQKVNRKDTRHHWTSLDTTRNWVQPPRQRISSLLYAKLVREVELFSGCAKRCLLTTDKSQLFRCWGYTLAPLPERNCQVKS